MDLGLGEQTVIIAGSSRGIGKAIARAFLAEGARVMISGRDEQTLRAAEEELRTAYSSAKLLAMCGDMTEERTIADALARAADELGPIDSVVANIGTGRSVSGWQVDDAEWRRMFDLNFYGAVRLITAALPGLIERKSGSIVVMNSIAALEAFPAPLPYSSAKAALVSYVKNLSRLIATAGVRINAVAPGNIFFPGGSWERKLEADRESIMRYIAAEVPQQRFGKPEEIADLVTFLCSTRSEFITGACFVADGGQTRSF
jgi:3-oxoacyl-[acyl-carrier protein] reductase